MTTLGSRLRRRWPLLLLLLLLAVPHVSPAAGASSSSHATNSTAHAADAHHHGEPLGVAFPFLMFSLAAGTAVKTLTELLPRGAYHPP
eukprot:SAG25_NODE_6749_length_532_cov_1.124711_1_plen_87_part_01